LCSASPSVSTVYIFEPIEEKTGAALFDIEWEESLTHNELALD
jgi:hypothetical protein